MGRGRCACAFLLLHRQGQKINPKSQEWRSPLMDGMDSAGGLEAKRRRRRMKQTISLSFQKCTCATRGHGIDDRDMREGRK